MAVQLLTTKLHRPPMRPGLAPRPHLIDRLNAALEAGCKLMLLAAPAGCGKTTLVAQWLQQLDLPSGWLSLDEGDNQPDRFLSYVAAALRQLDLKVSEIEPALPPAGPLPLELVMTALINDIAATPQKFILVLDDFHAAEVGPIPQLLDFWIERLPPQMSLVMTTRVDPALNLSRLRVRGQIAELGATELKFSEAEVALLFNEMLGFKLSQEQLSILESRTEGWAAGLQLAALSLRGRPDAPEFIASFAGDDRYLFDYLSAEVLAGQPETSQTFLRRTSLLSRLSGPLCDTLLPEAAAHSRPGQQMLEELERQHLFITPLDNKRDWYRYHQLFADFLYHRLKQTEPDQIPILHGRAALWFEQQGLVEEAIDHALAAQDIQRAAMLIEGHFEAMLRRNETGRLIAWLRQLPEPSSQARPLISLAWAWLHLVESQFDEAEAWAQRAEAALAALPAGVERAGELGRSTILGHIHAIRATVAINLSHTPERVISLAQQALQHLPPDNPLLRAVTMLNLGDAYAERHAFDPARQAFSEAVLLSREAGFLTLALAALGSQGMLCERQGELGQATEIYRQALALGAPGDEQSHSPIPSTGKAYVFLARVLHEWNELETALQHVLTGLDCCRRWGHVGHLFDGYLQLAQIQQARADPAEAQTALAAAKLLVSQAAITSKQAAHPIPNHKLAQMTARLTALELHLALQQGQLESVKRWAQSKQPERPHFQLQLIWPRFWLDQGRFGQAARFLAELRSEAEATGQTGRLLKILILEAAAWQGQGEIVPARLALTQALRLAEPGGYIRTFVDESPSILALLGQVMAAIPGSAYTARLLTALKTGRPSQAQPLRLAGPSLDRPAEPLSERELEVLRLAALNLSNQAIAAQLVVSPNTVKTHLKRLYAKLDAHNRLEAIERGRRLGLL